MEMRDIRVVMEPIGKGWIKSTAHSALLSIDMDHFKISCSLVRLKLTKTEWYVGDLVCAYMGICMSLQVPANSCFLKLVNKEPATNAWAGKHRQDF